MKTDFISLEAKTQQYYQNIEHLILVVQQLSLARDLQTIMDIVRHSARDLTGSDGATFILRDNGQCYYVEEEAIAPLWKGRRFPLDICIGGWAMLHREPAVIANVYNDQRIPIEAYRTTFVKSLVTVPIRKLDPIGAIGTYWATPHEPTPEEIKILQALADSTAIAMENVELYSQLEQKVQERTLQLQVTNQQLREEIIHRQKAEQEVRKLSLTDELTKLNNRRGFFLLGEKELINAHHTNNHLFLFFIDLDGLKRVNDNYGHEAGDKMIVDAAELLKKTFRETDIIARLGGDEFVILTATNEENSDIIVNRLQTNIQEFNQQSASCYQLSFSIGIINCQPNSEESLDSLLVRADEAMYLQKKNKRTQR